ncbi:MAG: lycopene cyclase domain-containing protein, partial [Bacteroidota bacterium]
FYRSWKYIFPSILVTAVFFVAWDILFTAKGVWSFNPHYILGIYICNLPLEEVLFFLCVPYSCMFIYEVMNAYVTRDVLGSCGTRISILISVISLATCIIYYDRTYTIVNAGICFSILVFAAFIYKFRNLGRFYLAFLVSLIPFLIFDGIITALPIVSYNDNENMAIRVLTIPVEDAFYCLSMLLCPVILMDYFKQRKTKE